MRGETNYGYVLDDFAAAHASPPCQDHSETQVLAGDHGTGWMLAATLQRLRGAGIPWVVENVDGAALARQDDLFGANGLELCGCMFPGLRGLLYENRLFETSFPGPAAAPRKASVAPDQNGAWVSRPSPPKRVHADHWSFHQNVLPNEGRRRMSAEWMTRDGLAQAIPPAYTGYLGGFLMDHLAVTEEKAC